MNTVYHRFEVTIAEEPLYDLELMWIANVMSQYEDINWTISESKRIILFDGVKDVHQLAKVLADVGLAEEVGMIKEITEYYPVYEDTHQMNLFER